MKNFIKILIISLCSSMIFAVTQSFLILYAEKHVDKKLETIAFLDEYSVPILTSAISSSLCIFLYVVVENVLQSKFNIMSNPFLDSIGIILGTLIFIMIYNIFNKIDKENKLKLTKENKHGYKI